MKITILCVGKIKENFYRQAIDEYAKRLSKYCKLEIIEVADEKIRIFEIGKEGKAYDNGNYHKYFFHFLILLRSIYRKTINIVPSILQLHGKCKRKKSFF